MCLLTHGMKNGRRMNVYGRFTSSGCMCEELELSAPSSKGLPPQPELPLLVWRSALRRIPWPWSILTCKAGVLLGVVGLQLWTWELGCCTKGLNFFLWWVCGEWSCFSDSATLSCVSWMFFSAVPLPLGYKMIMCFSRVAPICCCRRKEEVDKNCSYGEVPESQK